MLGELSWDWARMVAAILTKGRALVLGEGGRTKRIVRGQGAGAAAVSSGRRGGRFRFCKGADWAIKNAGGLEKKAVGTRGGFTRGRDKGMSRTGRKWNFQIQGKGDLEADRGDFGGSIPETRGSQGGATWRERRFHRGEAGSKGDSVYGWRRGVKKGGALSLKKIYREKCEVSKRGTKNRHQRSSVPVKHRDQKTKIGEIRLRRLQ